MNKHEIKQVIVIRKDLNMRKGKMCAQCSHAAMQFLIDANDYKDMSTLKIKLTQDEAAWFAGSRTKVVCFVDSENAMKDLLFHAELMGITAHAIIDEGRTEFKGVPTMTCAAFGPWKSSELNKLTGKLKLL